MQCYRCLHLQPAQHSDPHQVQKPLWPHRKTGAALPSTRQPLSVDYIFVIMNCELWTASDVPHTIDDWHRQVYAISHSNQKRKKKSTATVKWFVINPTHERAPRFALPTQLLWPSTERLSPHFHMRTFTWEVYNVYANIEHTNVCYHMLTYEHNLYIYIESSDAINVAQGSNKPNIPYKCIFRETEIVDGDRLLWVWSAED